MTKEKEREERAKNTLHFLLQLDEIGLLMIERDAKTLLARQRMEEQKDE